MTYTKIQLLKTHCTELCNLHQSTRCFSRKDKVICSMHLRISTLPIVCPGQEILNKIIPNRSQTLQGSKNVCWHCLQIPCFIWPHQLPQATEPKSWWCSKPVCQRKAHFLPYYKKVTKINTSKC